MDLAEERYLLINQHKCSTLYLLCGVYLNFYFDSGIYPDRLIYV